MTLSAYNPEFRRNTLDLVSGLYCENDASDEDKAEYIKMRMDLQDKYFSFSVVDVYSEFKRYFSHKKTGSYFTDINLDRLLKGFRAVESYTEKIVPILESGAFGYDSEYAKSYVIDYALKVLESDNAKLEERWDHYETLKSFVMTSFRFNTLSNASLEEIYPVFEIMENQLADCYSSMSGKKESKMKSLDLFGETEKTKYNIYEINRDLFLAYIRGYEQLESYYTPLMEKIKEDFVNKKISSDEYMELSTITTTYYSYFQTEGYDYLPITYFLTRYSSSGDAFDWRCILCFNKSSIQRSLTFCSEYKSINSGINVVRALISTAYHARSTATDIVFNRVQSVIRVIEACFKHNLITYEQYEELVKGARTLEDF